MSTHRPRRPDRDTAERLLRGAPHGRRGGQDPLAELLAAAAAPARADELRGEQAIMAAFRAAHLRPAPQQRSRPMIKTALAKLLTLKAAAVLAATAAGGVALAASTGTLPNPLSSTPSVSASAGAEAAATGKPTADPSHKGPQGSPSPSMVGLCHAFTAGAGSSSGKNLDSPAFQALITTAGGKDKVDAYCTNLLSTVKGGDASAKPESSKAGEHATAKPTSLPTSAPTEHSTEHPTSAPTTHPTH